MNYKLSIIVPIEIDNATRFRINRLRYIISLFQDQNSIEIVVVNSGKQKKYKEQIKFLCKNVDNSKYISCQMPEIYSAAQARNIGVLGAEGDYILFFDVDLWVDKSFLDKVLMDIASFKRVEQYAIYPCYYLNEIFSKKIEQNYENIDFSEIKLRYLKGYNDQVLYLAVNTSTLLINKKHFNSIGRYNEDFVGHGYEDFELIHRLYTEYPIIDRKDDYIIDYKTNFPADYQGFRKYFAYNALPNFFEDKCTIHLWHPRPLTKKYYKHRTQNAILFTRLLEESLKVDLSDKYIDRSILQDYKVYTENLLIRYGFNKKDYHGFFYLKYDSQKNIKWYKKINRKVRKLFFNPKQFILDMEVFKFKNK